MTTSPLSLPTDQDHSGRQLGAEEIAAVSEALESGTLTSTKGTFTKALEARFAELLGVGHAFACTSGTAAVHTAIAAIDPEPGEEVITTSITDMGALAPIVYEGAIPVFADVDPVSLNVTADTIAARISDRTRAILVTHLFGNPCDMEPIMALGERHGIPVIEDCAQAYLARCGDDRVVGSMGLASCFSLQQGKHITTGEGGIVATNDDALARRMFLYINKAWGYGDAKPDHYFLALNYRMSELVGAVALAQLDKLRRSVEIRLRNAERMTEAVGGLAGVLTPPVAPGHVHTFWKYCLTIDPAVIPGGPVTFAAKLKERGIWSAPRYIQKPAFRCQVFAEQRTFGQSRWPFTLARPEAVDYSDALFRGTLDGLASVLVLPWNEGYTAEHVDHIATAVREVHAELTAGGAA